MFKEVRRSRRFTFSWGETPMSEAIRSKRIYASRACTVAALLFAIVFCSVSLPGQNATGNISGTVTDASGAIIPKATFTVTISANGFRSWEQREITMTQGNNLNVPNIKLEVGSSKQEIQVVGNEVVVPTDTGAVSHTLNEQMITELAIQGRDAAELMKIMPGMGNAGGLNQQMFTSLTTQSNTGPIGTMSAQGTQLYGGMTMTADGASLL